VVLLTDALNTLALTPGYKKLNESHIYVPLEGRFRKNYQEFIGSVLNFKLFLIYALYSQLILTKKN